MIDFNALRAPFAPEDIHWRAQTVTGNGDKALALAYIDARNVMERLDAVCGPEGWRDSYVETGKGRVICTLSLRIGDEWVSKSDGAGETDVEGDKGALSDALKRAAVKWGVGRYLYSMPNVWVPCECYAEKRNNKWIWKRWIGNPWDSVKNAPSLPALGNDNDEAGTRQPAPREKLDGPHASKTALRAAIHKVIGTVRAAHTDREINAILKDAKETMAQAERDWPALINGDPNNADDPGLKGAVVAKRAELAANDEGQFGMLIQSLKGCQTVQSLTNWMAANEAMINELDDADRRKFETARALHESTILTVAKVTAG